MSMIEFENIIEIRQPVDVVFSFVANFENLSKWNYYITEVIRITEEPIELGTKFHQIRKTDTQLFRISEYQIDEKVCIKTLPNYQPSFYVCYTFETHGDVTRIINKWKLDTGKPVLIEIVSKRIVKNAVKNNLLKLKQLLENGKVQLQDGRIVFY